jgi:hypothetical protein
MLSFMPSSLFVDEPIGPHPLLETTQVSDFARNFRQIQKASKRPYSLLKLIREMGEKPARVTGLERECSEELQLLNPTNRDSILVQ